MLLKNNELDAKDEEELLDLLIDQPIAIDVDKQEEAKMTFSDKYICPFKNKDFSSYPDTFILTADLDILRDEGKSFSDLLISCNEKSMYYNLLFSEHGFLDFSDIEVKEEIYNKIKEFLNS